MKPTSITALQIFFFMFFEVRGEWVSLEAFQPMSRDSPHETEEDCRDEESNKRPAA